MTKRVVITGMAGFSPIGNDMLAVFESLRTRRSGVQLMSEWSDYEGLSTQIAAPVRGFEVPAHYDRKKIRSMGRVALLSTRVSELALIDAGLLNSPVVTDGSMGISFGSSTGSPPAIGPYARVGFDKTLKGITGATYIQMMSHTCAANLGQFFEIKGRVITTCSACTSGSQGIGYGYEAIKFGKQTLMLVGGAEELSVTEAAVFDVLFVASRKNETPEATPRPFDVARDGLVIGEGACALILEELDHAQARGAQIYAEIVGYGTNADGKHITNPAEEGMRRVMELALDDAALPPSAISYVNAHGTGTELGDIAETQATSSLFGRSMPISSLKSYMGHTLGAAGALEAWMTVGMLNSDWYAPTINLDTVDSRCGELDYVQGDGHEMQSEYVMSNNFAFGGINTSLIFRRYT